MIIQFQEYLTFENIFLYSNYGVLPFWLMIILIPSSKITKILVNSVIIPLILAITYIYVIYKTILLDESLLQVFQLYLNLDNLYTLFSIESFLLVFWLHFLALNLLFGPSDKLLSCVWSTGALCCYRCRQLSDFWQNVHISSYCMQRIN